MRPMPKTKATTDKSIANKAHIPCNTDLMTINFLFIHSIHKPTHKQKEKKITVEC